MKLSGCPVFTVKSVGFVALGVVVGGVYVFYRKMTTKTEEKQN